jgi:hypothetical protein
MKRLFFLTFSVCLLTLHTNAQTTNAGGGAATVSPRASAGDKVWVIINHVKPDKRTSLKSLSMKYFGPWLPSLVLKINGFLSKPGYFTLQKLKLMVLTVMYS